MEEERKKCWEGSKSGFKKNFWIEEENWRENEKSVSVNGEVLEKDREL